MLQITKVETKPWAIIVVVVCTIFTSIGSYLFKVGMDRFVGNFEGVLAAWPVLVGGVFYFLGFVLLTYSFRHGELSVLFPFVSLGFIWVAVLSYLLLGEKISSLEMAGIGAIVLGVVVIGLSDKAETGSKKLRLRG